MHTGYIKLWRKFSETSFFKDSKTVHLAIYLLLKCNHEKHKFIFNGKETTLDRGQCITGLPKMSSDTGISFQSLRTCLHTLSNTGFLTSKSTNRFRIISIDKYQEYQGESTGKPTDNQQATNRPLTTNNNDKKDKNEKKEDIPQSQTPIKPHKETAEQYIVRQFKIALGVPELDKDWDKACFSRNAKAAVAIIGAFQNDKTYATRWAREKIEHWTKWAKETGKSFSLERIAQEAQNDKGKYLEEKARIEKYNRQEGNNDKQHTTAKMGADYAVGQIKDSGLTQIGKAVATDINKAR